MFRKDYIITIHNSYIIIHILHNSFSADPLVGGIATQYLSNRQEHDKMAKEWTRRFAT